MDAIHQPGPNFEVIVGYKKEGDAEFTKKIVSGDKIVIKVENPGSNAKYEVYVQSKNDLGMGPKVR